jgi:hypothetical protein
MMEFRIGMTRKTYNAVCNYLQRWSRIYSLPGVNTVLAGSIRKSALPKQRKSGVILGDSGISDAKALAKRFDCALHGLGRAHVTKTLVRLDLRDLTETEIEALILMARVANLKGMQRKALERIEEGIRKFNELPALVRLAAMAAD